MWFEKYELILFDFDGLLVDTENLHFLAYQKMCSNRGYKLLWTFEDFCKIAHFSAHGLRKALYETFPLLHKEEPSWEVLYREKKAAYEELLDEGHLTLMPGVESLLQTLEKQNKPRVVVTNSPKIQIEKIKAKIPTLSSIPLWITREDYTLAKPSPDGYLTALRHFNVPGKLAIGFEDSFKGLQALYAAHVKGILICPPDYPQVAEAQKIGAPWFSSLAEINRPLA